MNALPKAKVQYTYDDYKLLPNSPRYELVEGEFHMSPAPFVFHQTIVFALAVLLKKHVEAFNLGWVFISPVDVVLSVFNVVQPDIFFVSKNKKTIVTRKNIQGSPDLMIEILSPSTSEIDLHFKRKLYFQFGVSEYWIVDPDRKNVEVLEWTEAGYKTHELFSVEKTLTSPLLQGLELNLFEIFVEI